jgi:hypothetical protein
MLAGKGQINLSTSLAPIDPLCGAFEHVVGPFECGELGAAVLELDTELSNSCSCG